jgi:hypothetical protein
MRAGGSLAAVPPAGLDLDRETSQPGDRSEPARQRVPSGAGAVASSRRSTTAPLSSRSSSVSPPLGDADADADAGEAPRRHDLAPSSARTSSLSRSITAPGQPRRVVISGPIRRERVVSSSVTVPENRLQPVLPETCWAESNVIVRGGESGVGDASASTTRQLVPASGAEALEEGRAPSGDTPAGAAVFAEAEAEAEAAASAFGVVFAHATASARNATPAAVLRTEPF